MLCYHAGRRATDYATKVSDKDYKPLLLEMIKEEYCDTELLLRGNEMKELK